MAVAAAVTAAVAAAAAAAPTTPATTTHGAMQPVLEHYCDPLIRGNEAGGVREEERRFSGWISLLTAGKNGGECSMEGDGLRAEGETMDGREQTPSGMGSGVDLELYMDSYFASRDTNRRSVSGGVVMCAGACVSGFFLGRRRVLPFLLLRQSMLRWPRGSRRRLFLRYIWSFIFPDRDVE